MIGNNFTPGAVLNDDEKTNEPVKDRDASAATRVLFETPSHYSCSILIIIAFSFSMGIVANIPMLVDPETTQMEQDIALKSTIWTAVSFTIVFFLIFPKSFTIYSNATVGVKTLGAEYKFSHIMDAREVIWNDLTLRPRWKFASSTSKRVIITRATGKWDLVVSPTDIAGFLAALQESVRESMRNDDKAMGD